MGRVPRVLGRAAVFRSLGEPANIAFNNKTKSLLVTNHASFTGLPDPSFLFASS